MELFQEQACVVRSRHQQGNTCKRSYLWRCEQGCERQTHRKVLTDFTIVFVSPVHVRQQRTASQLRHSPDDLHPPPLQRSVPDHHLPLQELRGLQGREDGQLEEGCDPQRLQRPGAQSRGKQPLQIHGGAGLLLCKWLRSFYTLLHSIHITICLCWAYSLLCCPLVARKRIHSDIFKHSCAAFIFQAGGLNINKQKCVHVNEGTSVSQCIRTYWFLVFWLWSTGPDDINLCCSLQKDTDRVSVCLLSTASDRQLGQDGVWVQDTENSKTSYCGSRPCGHWWLRSRVRHRHRARVLLVRTIAVRRGGQSWDYWTDSWRVQPRCTYKYWELLWPCGKDIYCASPTRFKTSTICKLEECLEFT